MISKVSSILSPIFDLHNPPSSPAIQQQPLHVFLRYVTPTCSNENKEIRNKPNGRRQENNDDQLSTTFEKNRPAADLNIMLHENT